MRILCISTLDKFSRFYLDIKHHLKTNTDVQLKVYAINFSGFFYTFLRLKYSCWISVKSWLLAKRKKKYYSEIIDSSIIYKGIHYNEYIKFHQNLNKNIPTKALQLQALAYIDIFDDIFDKEILDYLITIGDSRLSIEIAIALARLKKIEVFFIEQGPFNTTFFDSTGVNANISIRKNVKNTDDFKSINSPDIDLKSSSKKYNRSPLYRGIDVLLMTLFESTYMYPPDLKYTDLNSYRHIQSNTKIEHLNSKKRSVLLVLQVPLDVNMIYHSPNFKSHTEILESIYSNLPKNVQLIVREHPLYINKYEKTLYQFIAQHHITVDNTTNLNTAIQNAEAVIVNNSTVGIEAILNYKPVVVLGNAFYDNDAICLKLKNKDALKQILENALSYAPNKEKIDNFKHLLFSSVLIKGAITDKDLQSSKHIANYLLANH